MKSKFGRDNGDCDPLPCELAQGERRLERGDPAAADQNLNRAKIVFH